MDFEIATRTLHRSGGRLGLVPDQQCGKVERRDGYALRHNLRHEYSAIRDDVDVAVSRLDHQVASANHQIIKRRAIWQDDHVVGIRDQLDRSTASARRGGRRKRRVLRAITGISGRQHPRLLRDIGSSWICGHIAHGSVGCGVGIAYIVHSSHFAFNATDPSRTGRETVSTQNNNPQPAICKPFKSSSRSAPWFFAGEISYGFKRSDSKTNRPAKKHSTCRTLPQAN